MKETRLLLFFLVCTYWIIQVSDGGHTLVVAPLNLKLPMNALIGLVALKVSKLSLLTSLLSAGKVKLLKSARKRKDFPIIPPLPPPGIFPPPHFGGPPSPFGEFPGGPPPFHIGPPPPFGGFPGGPPPFHIGPPLPFGGFPHGPPFQPPRRPPFIPHIPPFLKTKFVDPKDACIMRQVCNFEFHPDHLAGGSMEKLLLALFEKPKRSRYRRDDTDFWINIQKVPKDEKLGTDICENRYPSCFFSPIFRTRRRRRNAPVRYSQSDVKELEDRIWELYWRLLMI